MILNGFEIENWGCVKRLRVENLPPSGVIVLHGPNRTGKSSIVQALRACLMDYASSTTALKHFYPRGTAEKPTVSVQFSAGGVMYRIKKNFGSNKSEFAVRTAGDAWRVEATTSPEAHSRVCQLAGGDDSTKGLHQLLWLTQAEFRLPEPKKFDPTVQAQLRGLLGVLQTPLDDAFLRRVKERWNNWYSGQRKAGKKQEMKKCLLLEKEQRLTKLQEQLKEGELKFKEVERLLDELERLRAERFQLIEKQKQQEEELKRCEDLRQRCQARIAERKLAEQQAEQAQKELETATKEFKEQVTAVARLAELQRDLLPAQQKVEQIKQAIAGAEKSRQEAQARRDTARDRLRQLRERDEGIARRRERLARAKDLEAAESLYERAKTLSDELASLEKELQSQPAPNDSVMHKLKENRLKAQRLRAELNAASLTLEIAPEPGGAAADLVIDGGRPQSISPAAGTTTQAVRRQAALTIAGWGRVEIRRGSAETSLDDLEQALKQCDEEFANLVAPYGISPRDEDALNTLIDRAAAQKSLHEQIDRKKRELKQQASQGLAPLAERVRDLKAKLAAAAELESPGAEPLPEGADELEEAARLSKQACDEQEKERQNAERQCEELAKQIEAARKKEMDAKVAQAECASKLQSAQEALARFATAEQLQERLAAAQRAVEQSAQRLQETELSAEEATIDERLDACRQGVAALQDQIREVDANLNRIKGRLEASEGLHTERAQAAARVEELARAIEAESLERDAVDRLYELFEECREKQLGALTSPIQERVLGWMRVLDLGDYRELRFSDAFLPEKLVRRDGTAEFALDEESTGAQEQIGMLVRLALGSLLTKPDEPAVAILDDPLTHADVGRLTKMCNILRRAAEGDDKLTPPAGPLQIIILTCHPEWFRGAGTTLINLEDPQVMERLAV
jgi:DNA repair exonuclease SbcCD ATPase subunit